MNGKTRLVAIAGAAVLVAGGAGVAVAAQPGTTPAPVVHTSPIPDASSNPATAPVHQYHLGLWFNSPADAVAAGCPGTVTPFNGDHTAGVQALSTRQFRDDRGPLRRIRP